MDNNTNTKISVKDLVKMHQFPLKQLHLPRTKALVPENTDEENNKILEYLNLMKQQLEQVRVHRRKFRSEAIWIQEKNCAKITRLVGKIYPQFGFKDDKHIYLSPEECLYLMEMNKLELLWNGVPFSIEQGYAVFCDTEQKLSKYRSFKELALNGYKIKHHKFEPGKRTIEDHITSSCSNTVTNKKIKHDGIPDNDLNDLFEELKTNGPSNYELQENHNSLFNICLPQNQEMAVITKPSGNEFSLETVSQNDSNILTSFTGTEAVAIYQFHKVNLDNN